MPGVTVLHVHPETQLGQRVQERLAQVSGLEVTQCQTIADAERWIQERDVDCLVATSGLADGSVHELVTAVRERAPDVGCVLYSGDRHDRSTDRRERSTDRHDRSGDGDDGGGTDARLIAEFVPIEGQTSLDRLVDLVLVTGRDRTQTTYPLPDRERERVESLERYDLDDQRPALQDVVDRAASALDVPQATINVVAEDEQRFLVCHDENWTSVPRCDSICTYAILDQDPTLVADAPSDPRFEATDAIDDLGIRSYAAAPIEADDGLPIATLCVYDEQPDRFDESDAALLQSLARDAAAVIATEREQREVER